LNEYNLYVRDLTRQIRFNMVNILTIRLGVFVGSKD